jgi:hypothetical protein
MFLLGIYVSTRTRPIYGPEAIEKYLAEAFKEDHFSNHIGKADQYIPLT